MDKFVLIDVLLLWGAIGVWCASGYTIHKARQRKLRRESLKSVRNEFMTRGVL